MKGGRVVVIGLDGATWKLLDPLLAEGRLPNLKKLMERGVYGDLETTIPAVTYMGWKSYSTGKNPGKLGVFYWYKLSDLRKGKVTVIDSTSYKSEELWDWLGTRGYKCGVISMPMTYPPKEINGFMICGIPALESMDYTYPSSLKAELEKMGHRILPEGRFRLDESLIGKKEADSRRERTIIEWEEVTEKNFLLAQNALKQGVDFLHITIQATDQMGHYMWKPLVEQDEGLAGKIYHFWNSLDTHIGDLISELDDNDYVFIMSDHGMNMLRSYFHLNNWLIRKGYFVRRRGNILSKVLFKLGLNVESAFRLARSPLGRIATRIVPYSLLTQLFFRLRNAKGRPLETWDQVDWSKSRVLMVGDGHIYINLPKGNRTYEEFREELIEELKNIKHPETNECVIDVAKPEEIYHGPLVEDFDLVVIPREGYSIETALVDADRIWTPQFSDGFTAFHDRFGIFAACGPAIKNGVKIGTPKIYDLAPTILHIMDVPISREIDGKVLKQIFIGSHELARKEVCYQDSERSRIRARISKIRKESKV